MSDLDRENQKIIRRIREDHATNSIYEVIFEPINGEVVEICIDYGQSGVTRTVVFEIALNVIMECTTRGIRMRTRSFRPLPSEGNYEDSIHYGDF